VQTESTSAPKEITIKNKGSGSLIIDSVTVTGINADNFITTNSCHVISPGSSCKVYATFKPGVPLGKKIAIISIASHDIKHPILNVKLTGRAEQKISAVGTWTIAGHSTVRVSIKSKSQTARTSWSDEFTFSDEGHFEMTDMDGTWSPNGSKFTVNLGTETIKNYFEDELRNQIGTDVTVEVTTMSFTGTAEKNGTMKGNLKLAMKFYVPTYSTPGSATVSATFTGTRLTTSSPLLNKKQKHILLPEPVLRMIKEEMELEFNHRDGISLSK